MSSFSLLGCLKLKLHILPLFRVRFEGWGGDPNFFLQISFSLVKMSFHVEFHLPGLPGSALKFSVGGGGWWVLKVILVFSFSPNLWFRLWIWTWTKLAN